MRKKFITHLLVGVGVFASTLAANAQVYFVGPSQTQITNTDPTFTPRLFSDNGFTIPAPTSTVVWFVSSVDSSVPTAGNGGFGPGGVLGSDDTLVRQITIDADAGGGLGAGQFYLDAFTVPAANSNKNIFVYLWNRTTGTPQTPITPVLGNTFGTLNLGVKGDGGGFGNADWSVWVNISSAQFTVAPIPEPSILALAGIGSLGLILRRRLRR